jgi:hypothetical protein
VLDELGSSNVVVALRRPLLSPFRYPELYARLWFFLEE